MKILARSLVMFLALGFGAFGDLFDAPNTSTVNVAIVTADNDADVNKMKSYSFYEEDGGLFSTAGLGPCVNSQILAGLLDSSPIPRYKLLSVYRV